MITFKCKNCGGEATINNAGDVYCPYCGTKAAFSDRELAGYKDFRNKMLEYLVAVSMQKENESDAASLWLMAEEVHFITEDEEDILVKYLYEAEENGIRMYAAKSNIIYHFPASKAHLADKMLDGVLMVKYPQADIDKLKRCIPEFAGKYKLSDKSVLMAFSKPDNMYPLSLFGSLPYEHVAWIVSRMENISCLLEYGNITHADFTPDTVFINPKMHEALLAGGWWEAKVEKDNRDNTRAIRKMAKRVLGASYDSIPKMFKEFINGRPKDTAFDDFAYWDKVIEEGLGGRHFHTLGLDKIKK